MIVAYLMMIVLLFVTINLVVDMLYTVLDPRVRLESEGVSGSAPRRPPTRAGEVATTTASPLPLPLRGVAVGSA